MKLTGVRAIGQGLTGVLGLLVVVPDKLLYYVIGNLIAFVLPIVFILVYDKTKGVPKEEEEEVASVDEDVKVPVKAVVDGTVIPVADIKDGVFSEKVLGDGIGILPESETIVAPADGEICTVMEGNQSPVTFHTGMKVSAGKDIVGE